MKKIQTKSVEAVVNFNRPLSCNELVDLIDESLEEYNKLLRENWKKLPILKRIVKRCYKYNVHYYSRKFYSIDGMKQMKPAGPYQLDPEFYPDAKYENRYLVSIFGNGKYLYFGVIPGVAEEEQYGTWIKEEDTVSCITIKANLKSNTYWKSIQSTFLQEIVPIIERIEATE